MFNREQFMMTGVMFLLLAGTSLFLSGATLLRNQDLYRNEAKDSTNIAYEINHNTLIISRAPAQSNNSDPPLRTRSRNRSNSVVLTTNNDVQSNIMYSADFNNMVDIRTQSQSLSNQAFILAEREVRDRERNRLDELRARNQNGSALNEATATDSEFVTSADNTENNESRHNVKANLERATGSPCVKVWDELDQGELSDTVCIELYRDNGDNVPNCEEDTLVGFTLVTDHLNEDNLDYYEFNNLPSGNYFAKFYHLGHEAPVFEAIRTVVDSHAEENYNSWETPLMEASPVDAGYCVRFEREENSEIRDELNGLTIAPSWESD